jgi:hypothetical protein
VLDQQIINELEDNTTNKYIPDGIILGNNGVIFIEGDEDLEFHSDTNNLRYMSKNIAYNIVVNHKATLTAVGADVEKIIKDNIKEEVKNILNTPIYNGDNATLIRISYNKKLNDDGTKAPKPKPNPKPKPKKISLVNTEKKKKKRKKKGHNWFEYLEGDFDNIIFDYKTNFSHIIREVIEIVRYFQPLFYNCIVLVYLDPGEYGIETIDCNKYDGQALSAIKMFENEKEQDNDSKMHFFHHESTDWLLNLNGLAFDTRDAYLKNTPVSNPRYKYEFDDELVKLFTPRINT